MFSNLLVVDAITSDEIVKNAESIYNVTWIPQKSIYGWLPSYYFYSDSKYYVNLYSPNNKPLIKYNSDVFVEGISDSDVHYYLNGTDLGTGYYSERHYSYKYDVNNYLFLEGNEYHIPYGQNYDFGGYVGYNRIDIDAPFDANSLMEGRGTSTTIDGFAKSTESPSFYMARGLANNSAEVPFTSTFYAMDCSSFVSLVWRLPYRRTTSTFLFTGEPCVTLIQPNVDGTISNRADYSMYGCYSIGDLYNNGYNTVESVVQLSNSITGKDDISLNGYAICIAGSHVILIASTYEDIVVLYELTPPEMKETVCTWDTFCSKYSHYSLYRLINMD